MRKITVLLVDDHSMFREGLRALLDTEPDVKIVGQGKNGREALVKYSELKPDVTVMDISMPQLNGLQAARQILHNNPQARIIMLSAYNNLEYVKEVIAMGVSGYLVKQHSAELLSKAIREVYQGRKYYCPVISKDLCKQGLASHTKKEFRFKSTNARLTLNEAELLQLLAEGQVNKLIASDLDISILAVKRSRRNLMDKLHIHDVSKLTPLRRGCRNYLTRTLFSPPKASRRKLT